VQVVYAQEEAPNPLVKSIFLVGPTPRNQDVQSWRPAALRALEICGYNGTVFRARATQRLGTRLSMPR
jgi:hypothetical protein